DVRQRADQPIGPAAGGKTDLLAWHELQRAMRAEMQRDVGAEVFADVTIEGGKGVRRREPTLEEQPHRIALVAEGGLQANEHIAEALTQNEQRAAIALVTAWRGPPLRLDFGEMPFAADMGLGRDARMNIGVCAIARGVADENAFAQRLFAGRDIDRIARRRHALEEFVERREDSQKGRGASAAGVGREIEQNDRDLALCDRPTP